MSTAPAHTQGASRVSTLLVLACTSLALANLPARELPLPWLLAFVAPGALLSLAMRVLRRPWARALLAVVLQTSACWVALELAGPMARPTALACTILPPLGFATMRQQEADRALALFLAFCVLLVGVILDGMHLPLIAAFGTCACLAMRCASHLAAHAVSRPAANAQKPVLRTGLLGASLPLIAGCLFSALAIERTLTWLPSPTDYGRGAARTSAAREGPRRAGLSDSFVLGGGRGLLSELGGEQLLRVRRVDGGTVASDLYLRSSFFAVPSMDRWQIGALELGPASHRDGHVLRSPRRDLPVHELEIERRTGAQQFVFVPPGSCEVAGLTDLSVDATREWIRQRHDRNPGAYQVAHQDLPLPDAGSALDPRARGLGLLALPAELDRRAFTGLLDEWRVGNEPLLAMARIAAGLGERCRYDRIEPAGPHRHALSNFLFADGDRRGYCMHFASAGALLLRMRGIPCRIGVGLFGGAPDRSEPDARAFGSQHAHAWVEVPFAEHGWVVWDPTPAAERGRSTPTRLDTGSEDLGPAAPVNAVDDDPWAALLEFVLQPWLLAVALLLAVAASAWSARAAAPATQATAAPVVRSARRLLARLLQALAAAGHPRRRGQTLERFAAELARIERLEPQVAAAFAAYQQVRFGGRPFDAAREETLRAGVESARALRLAAASDVTADRSEPPR